MGILDDVLQQLTKQGQVPQGSAQPGAGAGGDSPLVVVIQDLLLGKQPGGAQPRQQQAEVPQARPAAAQQGQDPQGGAADGLGGLLAQLQAAGLDDVVRSWIGTGENKPVQPDDLGDALGKKAVNQMADKTGCNPNDLLAQLANALPGIIDKLTHDGRIPSQQEVAQRLRQ